MEIIPPGKDLARLSPSWLSVTVMPPLWGFRYFDNLGMVEHVNKWHQRAIDSAAPQCGVGLMSADVVP